MTDEPSSVGHPRYMSLWKQADHFVKSPCYKGSAYVIEKKLREAVEYYWKNLDRVKQSLQITDRIDRHKVGAYTTLCLFKFRPIGVSLPIGGNSYLKLVNEFCSIDIGFSRIGKSTNIPSQYLASLIQQFDNGDATLTSLSALYCLFEELIEKAPLPRELR